MVKLALAPMEKILKAAGAKRVSLTASKAMAEVIEEIASSIASDAVVFAKHSGRRTVVEADVKLASKRLRI